MKKNFIFLFLFSIILLTSCTAVSLEPYRSADTLGPLHFRGGISFEGGFLSYANLNNDTLKDLGILVPMVSAFAGFGVSKNIDIYGSVAFPFITKPVYGAALKFKFIDKLGFKSAIIPAFKYNVQNDVVVLSDTLSYLTYGIEMPLVFTYSIFNFLLFTGGVHSGYYRVSATENGSNTSYDFFSYGLTVMPEIKFFNTRVSLGCDLRYYKSLKYEIDYSNDLNYIQKHVNPFVNFSFQF